ncbi:outer mitochondrial membrane transport complex protein-domain-containing protein [Biscogniauxia mediterranea]|nr:outer mitochondrial membrane transport complex protein-domain-containing protein [Biscogniauxia mediterranea]
MAQAQAQTQAQTPSLELHVWGPAFGLDSIDPECLAAIAYFRSTVSSGSWTLIASNDASVSPNHVLPALLHKGTWISGYSNIVDYLTQHVDHDTGDDLIPLQAADALAYASYLTTRGQGLLAVSLYASPSAWAEITRPAYSSLLPFPLTWTVPPALRSAAIEKAEQLGMGYLAADVDTDASSSPGLAETTSTGFLRLRQRLGPAATMHPEQTAAIRFQQLAHDFYSTLDQFRGDKRFFLGNEGPPTPVDFLAYGYLSLMRVETPHPILSTVLEKHFGRLSDFLGVMDSDKARQDLPWQKPPPRGVLGLLGNFSDGAVESVPGVGESWKRWRRGGVRGIDGDEAKNLSQAVVAVGGAVVALAALGATVLFQRLPSLGASTHRFEPPREEKSGLRQFGEIGAMLDGLPVWE